MSSALGLFLMHLGHDGSLREDRAETIRLVAGRVVHGGFRERIALRKRWVHGIFDGSSTKVSNTFVELRVRRVDIILLLS